jgi:hypothetical protein
MRKSHFNDEFFVLLGPIISRLLTCSIEEKNKIKKKQRVLALVLSLWFHPINSLVVSRNWWIVYVQQNLIILKFNFFLKFQGFQIYF